MITNDLRRLWDDLTAAPGGSSDQFRLSLLWSRASVRIFAAVAGPDQIGILLELPADQKVFHPVLTRAFELISPQVIGLSGDRKALLVLLKDMDFRDLFEALVADVIHTIIETS